jgi:hypothetical protein
MSEMSAESMAVCSPPPSSLKEDEKGPVVLWDDGMLEYDVASAGEDGAGAKGREGGDRGDAGDAGDSGDSGDAGCLWMQESCDLRARYEGVLLRVKTGREVLKCIEELECIVKRDEDFVDALVTLASLYEVME